MNYSSIVIFGVLTLALCVLSANANDSNEVRRSLGGYPVCEASAAIVLECPEQEDKDKDEKTMRCLLVGDNEINDRLFLFEIDEDRSPPLLVERREIYLGNRSENEGFKISDIEALTKSGTDKIAVYGSHSRSSKCEKKKKRHRFAESKLVAARISGNSDTPVKSTKLKCEKLFKDKKDKLVEKLCKRIVDADEKAEVIEESVKDAAKTSEPSRFFDLQVACSVLPTLNLEAAAAVKGSDGEERIWVGLRSPLIDGKAVLLRKDKETKFKFDAIALIELSGHGIRDLAFKSNKLWGIAGPSYDSNREHRLWHIDANLLKDGAELRPTVKRELPSYSEGLAILNGKAFVLIDGSDDEDSNPMVCRAPSEYIVIDLDN